MLLSWVLDEISNLIGITRQKGNTTALIKAVLETDGTLIVHDWALCKTLRGDYPYLNVFPITGLTTLRGLDPKAVFFDNHVIAMLCKSDKDVKDKIMKLLTEL